MLSGLISNGIPSPEATDRHDRPRPRPRQATGCEASQLSCNGRSVASNCSSHPEPQRCCELPMTQFALAVLKAAAAARRRRRWPRARFRRADGCGSAVDAAQQGRYLPSIRESSRHGAGGSMQRDFARRPRGCKGPRGGRLAGVLDRAPIGNDVAHRAFAGASARICSAITALRHWVPFGALVRSARADRQLHAQQGTPRTLAPRHESRTTRVLSRFLAAIGLDAASAACHYPSPRIATTRTWPFRGSDRRPPTPVPTVLIAPHPFQPQLRYAIIDPSHSFSDAAIAMCAFTI